MECRFCNHPLEHTLIDLGHAPPSNAFLLPEKLSEPENTYPLSAKICDNCMLVQVQEQKDHKEIFDQNYVYFSSMSQDWLAHARDYVQMAKKRFDLNLESRVVEIASNDGYLLQYFKEQGIPSLGIEPASGTAQIARNKGIETLEEFFNTNLANKLKSEGRSADLLIGNNVLAHVPNINDFVRGMKLILKDRGAITMEFPHLMHLINDSQFDTIYHEHFSYFSFNTVKKILEHHGLELFDVDELKTHGGSLRIYAKHRRDKSKEISPKVSELLERENKAGIGELEYYNGFDLRAEKIKRNVLKYLISERENGRNVIAYGAAAKGNTLLNYCGIKNDLIPFAIDTTPFKQGKYLPGSHIPVYSEKKLKDSKIDTLLILPWNHKEEIIRKLKYLGEKGTKFVVPVPDIIEYSSPDFNPRKVY